MSSGSSMVPGDDSTGPSNAGKQAEPSDDHPVLPELVTERMPAVRGIWKFRFGVTGLLIVTFVFGIQFALVSYFGAIAGIVMPALICILMVGMAFVSEIRWWRRRDWQERARFNSFITHRGFLYLVLLAASGYALGGAQLAYQSTAMLRITHGLQRDLGFKYQETYVLTAKYSSNMIMIKGLTAGSEFDQAGITSGDVVVTELSPDEFFQMMDENRGQQINITVASYSRGQYLEELPMRSVLVNIPARKMLW